MAEQQELIEPKVLKEGKTDEARYRKCAEPFATQDEAEAALKAFLDGVEALREECRIASVAVVVKDSSEDTGTFMIDGFWGNSIEQETILAWAFGKAQAERQQRIMELIGAKGLKAKRKR